jgi:hypothetical protein
MQMKFAVVLRYYAAHSGDSLPTFRDKFSGPSLKFKKFLLGFVSHSVAVKAVGWIK